MPGADPFASRIVAVPKNTVPLVLDEYARGLLAQRTGFSIGSAGEGACEPVQAAQRNRVESVAKDVTVRILAIPEPALDAA